MKNTKRKETFINSKKVIFRLPGDFLMGKIRLKMVAATNKEK